MSFRPKEKYKGSALLPVPATVGNIKGWKNVFVTHNPQKQVTFWLLGAFIMFLWYNPLGLSLDLLPKTYTPNYPEQHPFSSPHDITTSSKYIFPPVEHAPLLQELGASKLVKESRVRDANFPEIDRLNIFSLNIYDDPDPVVQANKEKDENAALELSKARNMFKNHDKIVYRPKNNKNYPDVIIVTALDFEKYTLGGLTAIAQNRIDYAHNHNYGVYIRWSQEFLPKLNSMAHLKNKEKAKWIRIFAVRAAMLAFPQAKWFWYLDQDGLIMNMNINLHDYVLSDEALDPIMLRQQKINPQSGIIKTYKSSRPNSVRLILTQSDEKIETHSFLVRNDDIGKSILEFWCGDLFYSYPNFPYGPESAVTHILQWHPFILSRSAIIPARTIAALHKPDGQIAEDDHLHYVSGDLAVSWPDCSGECENTLAAYNSILHPKKD